MKLFHTFTGAVLILLACNTKSEEKKSENWEHFVENTNENVSVETPKTNTMEQGSIYTFKVKDLSGNEFDFATLKGKKILIVNTASECGLTPQYEQLQAVYEKYKNSNFVIVGFPANNFGGQEPGTDAEIKQFCKARFGVKFPLASKLSVTGTDTAPIYKWLTQKKENGVLDATIKWNFNKFLLDENGKMIAYFPSSTKPDSPEITGKL